MLNARITQMLGLGKQEQADAHLTISSHWKSSKPFVLNGLGVHPNFLLQAVVPFTKTFFQHLEN